uniref:GST C-terminal domain-containing protein n=1 Tax=Aegilops tauschii subsp. strangulata TaxID=200361 RepID=A0A452YP09_AEGTS
SSSAELPELRNVHSFITSRLQLKGLSIQDPITTTYQEPRDPSAEPRLVNGSGGRRRRGEAARRVGQPVREQGADRAQPEGHQLRVRRGRPPQQGRAPPRLQPRAQEGARPHPQRQAHPGVAGHRAVHRRGLAGHRPERPPRRPAPARHRPVLGRLRRRQGKYYTTHRRLFAARSLFDSCLEVIKLEATHVLQVGSPWFTILFARKTEEKMEAAVRAISAMETLEGAFGESSGGKPFFGGDGIGFVDVVLGSYLGWFVVIEKMIGVKLLDAGRTPALAAWAQRFRMADAVKGVLPEDVDKVLEFLQTFLD